MLHSLAKPLAAIQTIVLTMTNEEIEMNPVTMIDYLNGVLHAFYSISVISRRQLTFFMFSWFLQVQGWALKCLAKGHSHEKTRGSSAVQTQDP